MPELCRMLVLKRTDAKNEDFIELVRMLDSQLEVINGDDHGFFDQYNKLDAINHAIVAYLEGRPVGCGAIKKMDDESMEVKRMYVREELRSRGIASAILKELEAWSKELGFLYCVLETGKMMDDAVYLYRKNNYTITENYGQYIGVESSVCMKKTL
jgi:putative acetyltransferase